MTRQDAIQRFKKEFTAAYRTPGHLYDSQFWYFIMYGWLLAHSFPPDEARDIADATVGESSTWVPSR